MRVLVTGAAGFIGSHTVALLLGRGDEVVGIDSFNDYYSPTRKRRNLLEVQQQAGARAKSFRFEELDVRDRSGVRTLVAGGGFDAIVHLAAMAGVRASVEDPWLYHDVNLTGTLNLFEAARRAAGRAPSVVLASTSSVYGRTETRPFVETDSCDRPLAPYASSKRAAEMLGHTFHHLHGLDVTALRFFTVYGPRGRPDMMAYKVLQSAFDQQVVPYYDQGKMYRDWTFVDDIVAGVIAAAERRLGYEVINLGRGEPVLVADFVRLLAQRAGRQPNLEPRPMPEADVDFTYADIGKAKRLLGYDPQVSVAEGVERFVEWFEHDRSARPSSA